jgi:hypothetical protein
MDAIHAHAKEGRKHGKVEGNTAFKTNDYIWVVHESWCHVNTKRNVWICNHPICNYMRLYVVSTTFATINQFHQIWGGFATILWLMYNYYLFYPPMWMLLGLYSSMNKPPWPISYMCNQNFVTNSCTICIMGI